jgi:hypothetical protein
VRGAALFLRGHRRLSLIFLFKQIVITKPDRTPDHPVREQS